MEEYFTELNNITNRLERELKIAYQYHNSNRYWKNYFQLIPPIISISELMDSYHTWQDFYGEISITFFIMKININI